MDTQSANCPDDPREFDDLPPERRIAVLAWIHHVMVPETKPESMSSYGLKHQFEEVGFHLTNGEFKGAMAAAGYKPVDSSEQNWRFKVRPAYRNRNTYHRAWDAEHGRYLMHHLTEEQRQQFSQLVWEALEQQERERQQAREESLAAAAEGAKGDRSGGAPHERI